MQLLTVLIQKENSYGKSLNDLSIDNFNDNVSLHLGSYFLVMQQFGDYFKRNNMVI